MRILPALALALAAICAPVNSSFGQPGDASDAALATFAGGCFWCMVQPFVRLDGVLEVSSGYTGGTKVNPTYAEVSAGTTGHYEAVQIRYDPRRIGYDKLLDVFWHNIDPHDAAGQFCDKGGQYRSAIFFHDETQRRLAEKSRAELQASGTLKAPVVTSIVAASTFYPAEDYHQNYYLKNPARYQFYRWSCGRDARLQAVWGAAAGGH